jgi:hypothetical protein
LGISGIGCDITARSSYYGLGIGTGAGKGNNTSVIGNLKIVIGNITASKSSYGPGIGTERGEHMHGISGTRSVAITSGT